MDIVSDILMRTNLRGSLYFHTCFSAPWGVDVPAYQRVARFHYAHVGNCFVRVEGHDGAVDLRQGDLLIVPRGSGHRLFSDPQGGDQALPLDRVVELSGFTGQGALVYGASPSQADVRLICGHFAFDDYVRHPLLDRLPPCLVVRNYGEKGGKWMKATLEMIADEAIDGQLGSSIIVMKMSEILFAQALRAYLAQDGAAAQSLAGFADPQILRALTAIHRAPAAPWTLAELAREAGLSRTGFAVRFARKMAVTPMRYLADWRMQLARHQLVHSREGLAEIAAVAGYISQAAFVRTFKKSNGVTPAAFRRALQGGSSSEPANPTGR